MKITTTFGGQMGSEGKGLLESYLATKTKFDLCTTDAAPNAGHVAIVNGRKLVTRHLPMTGVLQLGATIWLNGGSVISPEVLAEEIEHLESMGFPVRSRLVIHPHAAVIIPIDVAEEHQAGGPMEKISSTREGVGPAAARKLMRTGPTAKDVPSLLRYAGKISPWDFQNVHVGVAQGYGLGVNAGFYPYCTHRHCTPAQGLMNAGLPTNAPNDIICVIRTNPIRVGNLPNGYSGGCYSDQKEIKWEDIGQEPQLTTVTKRVRRLFTYSKIGIERMLLATAPTMVLVNFANWSTPATLNDITQHICEFCKGRGIPTPSFAYGYGPAPEDVQGTIRE